MDQLTPLNTVDIITKREFIMGFLVLCASSCVLPHRRYSSSSPQMKAESDRVSRLHCQWIGGRVNKAEQVIRPHGCSQHSLHCEEQTNCREKEEKENLLIKETSETYQSGAIGRPCLGSDMNHPTVKKKKCKTVGGTPNNNRIFDDIKEWFFFLGKRIKCKSGF